MNSRSDVPTTSTDRWTVLALAGLAVALTAVAGPMGLLAAVGVGVLRYVLETAAALAGGHVALVALFPGGIDPVSFVIAEVGLLLVLIEPASEYSRPLRFAAVAVASALALGGVAWVALTAQSVWFAGTALVVLFAVAAYGLHRYEVVRARGVAEEVGSRARSASNGNSQRNPDRQRTVGQQPEYDAESADSPPGAGT